MKRFFTITLIACILASVFPLGLGAAEANRDIEQNLVVHYDFDGTDEEYLKNKAENSLAEQLLAGTEQDDLTGDLYVKSDGGFLRDAEAGTLTGTEKTDSVYIHQALAEQVVRGEYTIFTRFKLNGVEEGSATNYYAVAEMRTFGSASKRPLCLMYADTAGGNDGVYVGISSVENAASNKSFVSSHPQEDVNARFVNVALVVTDTTGGEGDTRNYAASLYLSTGLPQDAGSWTCKRQNWVIGPDISEAASHLYLFSNGTNPGGVTIDDFRLYNTDLSLEQIAGIIPDGRFASEVRLAGTQESDIVNGTYSVRFIATLDSLTYEAAGFEILAQSENGSFDLSKACTTVYRSILASDDGKQEAVTAESLYGSYCMALAVTGIPVPEGEIQFRVRAYVQRDGEKIYTTSYVFQASPGADGVTLTVIPAA